MRFNSVSDGCSHALRYTAVIVLNVGLPLHSIFKTLALFLKFADFFFSRMCNECVYKQVHGKNMQAYAFLCIYEFCYVYESLSQSNNHYTLWKFWKIFR